MTKSIFNMKKNKQYAHDRCNLAIQAISVYHRDTPVIYRFFAGDGIFYQLPTDDYSNCVKIRVNEAGELIVYEYSYDNFVGCFEEKTLGRTVGRDFREYSVTDNLNWVLMNSQKVRNSNYAVAYAAPGVYVYITDPDLTSILYRNDPETNVVETVLYDG